MLVEGFPSAPMVLKKSRASRNLDWIHRMCITPDGDHQGKPIKLLDFQQDIIVKIYDNPHGTRRAIISFAKKNGKTTLSAALLLLHIVGPEAVRNSLLYSTGMSKEQAAILFGLAAKIARANDLLMPYLNIVDSRKIIACADLGTTYQALSAEVKTVHGISPIFVVHDEIGEEEGPHSSLYSAVENSCTAHSNPLSILISTQASTDEALLSQIIDQAKKNVNRKTLLFMYEAPIDLDPFSLDTVKLANPALGHFQSMSSIEDKILTAKGLPSEEQAYRRYVLNQRVKSESLFISQKLWESNNGKLPFPKGADVYFGLDLASVDDLAAFVAVAEIDGVYSVFCRFWLPEEGLAEKSRVQKVPYEIWKEQGFLHTCPGRSISYDFIADFIVKFFKEYNVIKGGFDRHYFEFLKPCLKRAGLSESNIEKFFMHGQGFLGMSPALKVLESRLLNAQIAHGDNPILKMCAANAVVQKDPAGNKKLNKPKSRGKIDGIVALAMAVGVAEREQLEDKIRAEDVWLLGDEDEKEIEEESEPNSDQSWDGGLYEF